MPPDRRSRHSLSFLFRPGFARGCECGFVSLRIHRCSFVQCGSSDITKHLWILKLTNPHSQPRAKPGRNKPLELNLSTVDTMRCSRSLTMKLPCFICKTHPRTGGQDTPFVQCGSSDITKHLWILKLTNPHSQPRAKPGRNW
jgi:hypothetical protein